MSFAVFNRDLCTQLFFKKFFVFLWNNLVIIRKHSKKLFGVLFHFSKINWRFQPWLGDFFFLIGFQMHKCKPTSDKNRTTYFFVGGQTFQISKNNFATNTMSHSK